jgi:hypothetical protein
MPRRFARTVGRPALRSSSLAAACAGALLAPALLTPAAHAAIAWDEVGQGDLANSGLSPTAVPLALGGNSIYGNLGPMAGGGIDRDYFTITVPAGAVLSAIFIEFYFGDDPVAFMGIALGSVITVDPDEASPADIDGYVLFGSSGLNTPGADVLPQLPLTNDPPRFTTPLSPGTYTFWVQQLGGSADYGFNFVLSVPSPGTAALLAMVFAATGIRTRPRR